MSLISLKHLTFRYDGSAENALTDFSADFDTDWRLALIGRNGRGKTTLMKLLAGMTGYAGTIAKSATCVYFPYPVKNADDIALSAARDAAPLAEDWEFARELNLLGTDPEILWRPFCSLSPGERAKVLLSALFLRADAYPLIDEPTNHLDAPSRDALADYLRSKKGFLVVSHDREFLDRCVDHVLSLGRTGAEVMRGNFSAWLAEHCAREEADRRANAKLKKEIVRLGEAAKRSENWADATEKSKYGGENSGLKVDRGFIGHKSAKMMQLAKNAEKRMREKTEEKAALFRETERAEALSLSPERYHSDRLLSLRGVSARYGARTVFEGLNLELRRGERVAITGANGCGKSTLLQIVCGSHADFTGERQIGPRLKISLLTQNSEGVCGSVTDLARERGADETLAKTILFKLDFPRDLLGAETGTMSEGQKKKVLLALSLAERAHLYVWDEPLNYIDVFSRMQIESLLSESDATFLFVEHDRAFCKSAATRTLQL